MTVAEVVAGLFGVGCAVVGLGLGVGGVVVLRRATRLPSTWVAVEAVVVHRTSHVRPASVTFDYPVPGGWLRARRVEGLAVTTGDGRVAGPGDRITVWVDPRAPGAVRLAAGSASSVAGVLLLLMGLMLVGLALWFTATALVVGR
ncbi:DUF3592 domain-containing protein [Cellulomonas wangsupingiae]|uniref:DUF3592 domain-containing protein n=1 Tax=Cellulomonas wangsupingiae TaxID=2968085 RepID=A0ABY5K253_9CELL|nr:DUF3592 domain-containing protein [Cellulomonas wangsupingiae]MCC2335870.1 DUF3592 domain-containing protein [Cellulomonas wangsupingiae]MCM0639841.1 DUF3592 domain-containing protein [Cellulomonas wangsupingiae]UUI64095.1 DUF3592 domain-containing protein [Cellulomonas wangsupingiae]